MFTAPTRYSASNAIAQPVVSMEESLDSDLSRRILQFDPDLESKLHVSRVYIPTEHRHSMSSLTSTNDSAAGLSFLSGISLAQISSISVISLPIFSYELWNPQQYRDIRSTDMSANLRAQNPTYSTTRSRSDTSDTKIRDLASKLTTGPLGFRDGVQVKKLLKLQLKVRLTAEKRYNAGINQILKEERNYKELRTNVLIIGGYNRTLLTTFEINDCQYEEFRSINRSDGGPKFGCVDEICWPRRLEFVS